MSYFDELFPRYKCPKCNTINRYANTFMEYCKQCKKDLTLEWEKYIIIDDE